jgi:hypothetical protein
MKLKDPKTFFTDDDWCDCIINETAKLHEFIDFFARRLIGLCENTVVISRMRDEFYASCEISNAYEMSMMDVDNQSDLNYGEIIRKEASMCYSYTSYCLGELCRLLNVLKQRHNGIQRSKNHVMAYHLDLFLKFDTICPLNDAADEPNSQHWQWCKRLDRLVASRFDLLTEYSQQYLELHGRAT